MVYFNENLQKQLEAVAASTGTQVDEWEFHDFGRSFSHWSGISLPAVGRFANHPLIIKAFSEYLSSLSEEERERRRNLYRSLVEAYRFCTNFVEWLKENEQLKFLPEEEQGKYLDAIFGYLNNQSGASLPVTVSIPDVMKERVEASVLIIRKHRNERDTRPIFQYEVNGAGELVRCWLVSPGPAANSNLR